jgi:hypothetical protein
MVSKYEKAERQSATELLSSQALVSAGGVQPPILAIDPGKYKSVACVHGDTTSEISPEAGLAAASSVLGHKSLETTLVYAVEDLRKAAELMRRSG